MLGKLLAVSFVIGLSAAALGAIDTTSASPQLSAAEIVNRNVVARGGLQAWRAVKSISEAGKLGAGGDQRETIPTPVAPQRQGKAQPMPTASRLAKEAQLPFLIEMERPRKVRLEVQFDGKTALQIYDGSNGWKVRPFLNRSDVEPFTTEELSVAAKQSELDGPLVDYAAKGITVELAGTEMVDNHPAFRLKLTKKNGQVTHVWIDKQTFLESKIEGEPRKLDGKIHAVEVYYRDYRNVNGLQIPFVLETQVLPLAVPEKSVRETQFPPEQINIEKVQINPKLDDSLFSKPVIGTAAPSHSGL